MFLQQLLHTIPITEKTRHPPTITNIVAILISVFQYLALTIHPSVLRKKTAQTINDGENISLSNIINVNNINNIRNKSNK